MLEKFTESSVYVYTIYYRRHNIIYTQQVTLSLKVYNWATPTGTDCNRQCGMDR